MRILVAGGGSGGHVTPVLAILEALAATEKNLEVCFVCDKKFAPQARTILAGASINIELATVYAGKLRRYHGVPMWKQLLDIPTVALNIRDFVLIGIGYIQSRLLLSRFKPEVVFGKGGFVCLPVGLAAHHKGIPLVIHDSDAHPGLTNRILAKWATSIATGAPLDNYNYDRSRSSYVGIPVGKQFTPASAAEQAVYKKQLMNDVNKKLIAVVGGGLGALPVSTAMVKLAAALSAENVEVIIVTGAAHGETVRAMVHELSVEQQSMYHIESFVDATAMATILKAADVVVSRGGATAMAELSLLHKATVLVPNPQLTGGQQLKNAKAYEVAGAVVLVDDVKMRENSTILEQPLKWILRNEATKRVLEEKIGMLAKPQAAREVAMLILQAAKGKGE